MTEVALRLGRVAIRVPKELLQAAAERCNTQAFELPASDPQLRLTWRFPVGDEAAGWKADHFHVDGDGFTAASRAELFATEQVLRIAWQVGVARQGGVLVHGASVRFGDRAVLGVGPSTAGKSTLARLCREAGGELLSDEMTALFPDGTVYGTPFRSTDLTPGHPGPARLGLLVLLDKAPHEALGEIAPEKALPRLLAQVYRGFDGGELSPGKILERVAAAMTVCPPRVLSFRKDPEAGHFVRRALEAM